MIPTIAQQITACAQDHRSPAIRDRAARIETTLDLIRSQGQLTASVIEKHLDISRHLAHDYLRALEHRGLITRHRSGNATIFTLAERPNKRRKAA